MNYIAEPLSRSQLRALGFQIRSILGIADVPYFPVLPVLENIMPLLFAEFNYEIVPKENFPNSKHADTDISNRLIRIREDVYYGAAAGNGRDRMTIAHEIAHYILLVVCGIKFNRSFGDVPIIPYKDPEWQAKALAGEIMCPCHLIKDMCVQDVATVCGVSIPAARYNLKMSKGGDVY